MSKAHTATETPQERIMQDENIPMQVLEDGKAASDEIARLRSAVKPAAADAEKPTEDAGREAEVATQEGKPTYEDLEDQNAKLKEEIENQRRDFDRKWGQRGAVMEQLKTALASREERVKALESDLASRNTDSGRSMEQSIQALHDEYGEDFVNGVVKLTGTKFDELEKKIADAHSEFRSMKDQNQARESARSYWDDFERLAPGALALNGDPTLGVPPNPEFVAFLDEEVPLYEGSATKRSRRQIAEDLNAAGDLEGLAEIFRSFKPSNANPKRDIREQVAPRSTRVVQAGPGSTARSKPVFKESEMDEFYRSIQDGKGVSAEEMETKQQQFKEAAAEGRIMWGK
jgi:hypothetical protein